MNFPITRVEVTDVFAGAGTLTRALIDGLRRHLLAEAVGCVEVEGGYLARWSAAHASASTFLGSVTKYHPAELAIPSTPGVIRIAAMGVPCTGTSKAGRSKNHLAAPEEHRKVGHLFLPAAHFIRQHRPDLVVFENVSEYAATLSARCLRAALAASGYSMTERVVNSYTEFAVPTERRRWVAVASRVGAFNWVFEPKSFTGTLGAYLDPEGAQDAEDVATPVQQAADAKFLNRKAAEGCGFRMRLVDRASTKLPTICRSYGKRQPSATFVKVGDSYRMIRPDEVRRLHGFPDDFPLPAAATLAYEIFGQGVTYAPFYALGEALGQWLGSPPVAGAAPAPSHVAPFVAASSEQLELFCVAS